MNHLKQNLVVVILCFSLALAACAPAAQLSLTQSQATSPAGDNTRQPTLTAPPISLADQSNEPAEVALLFYEAYTKAVVNFEPNIGSPVFQAQEYLSKEYLTQLAEIKAGFDGFGFDPVLQAQDVPPEPIEVKEVMVEGNQATVVLQFGGGLLENPFERIVSLEVVDGHWKIVPDRVDQGAGTPEEAVEAFYTWYLGYIGDGEEHRNPLVDKAYRAAPFLNGSLISRIDRMLQEGEGIGYDPFLCAQDVPTQVKSVASFDNSSRPIVLAETSFPGHYLVLDLIRSNFNQWAIKNISCGGTPAAASKAFYTWALDYMTSQGEMRNPWVEGAHRESPYLSEAYISELDGLLASLEPLPADPVFMAQDLPNSFTTTPCEVENCALVNMQFGASMIRQLRVEMVVEDGQLRIASIHKSEGPQPEGGDGWVPLVDEQYGYAVLYPVDWSIKGLNVNDQHTPEEYPLMRSITFQPGSSSNSFAFSLDVVVWPKEDLSEVYMLTEKVEEIQVNGYTAQVFRSNPGIIYTIFRHPHHKGVWIVFTDTVSQFPGREELAESVEGMYEKIISSIAFR